MRGLDPSKDIVIFLPDPQYLGFASPRLSEAAERVSANDVEGPGHVEPQRRPPRLPSIGSPDHFASISAWMLSRVSSLSSGWPRVRPLEYGKLLSFTTTM